MYTPNRSDIFLKGKAKGITPETALGSASHITAQTEEV